MMGLLFYVLFGIIFSYINCANNDEILCTKTTCEKVECPKLPDKCYIQNSTHNGMFLPSPEKCNCCPFCLEILNDGEKCNVGGLDSQGETSICGPGLLCNKETKRCSKIDNTDCTRNQTDYDNRRTDGVVGSMEIRANCDENGLFKPYKCIPGQSCYCVDKNGRRIFGQSDYTDKAEVELACQCSRNYEEAVAIIGKELRPDQFFKCKPNGDYDNFQCIGDMCMCVDSYDGVPTFPDKESVNITLIPDNTTLDCYDEGKYKPLTFYKSCAEKYLQIYNKMLQDLDDGYDLVISYQFPKCDLDWTYAPVQETEFEKYCVDFDGNVLITVEKTDANHEKMNCNCLRASSLISAVEKPKCDEYGNYENVQCRRGICRCVDEDGNQRPGSREVSLGETLSC